MSAANSEKVNQTEIRKDRVEQGAAILWMLMGFVVFVGARQLTYKAEYGPGPGFWPFWLGVGLMAVGLVVLVQASLGGKDRARLELPPKIAVWQMTSVMVVFFGFVFFAEKVGFLFCIGLMFLLILTFVEKRGWKFSLTIAVITNLIFWAIFEWGLKLRLPPGFLEYLR